VFATGLDRPVFLTHAGDQSGRIFVIEKTGRILILQDGVQMEAPFLDIVQLVNSRDSERGLLGLAFHPNFAENDQFFVNYTDQVGNTVIARYQVSDNENRTDLQSQEILLTIPQPYANHNGGMIAFGADGFLYIGMGDGGSGGDPQGNAQNPDTLLGKILRIDVDSGTPYGIPAGNAPGGRPEIWALGVRNPWRFSFDRATGDLLIGDVGQNQWEEIDILPAGILGGINLGWDFYEGMNIYEGTPDAESSFVFPVIEYGHGGGNCSVTGGYTYRGSQLPEWQGVYLFGDYCSGAVWGAIPDASGDWQTAHLFTVPANLSSFGEDENGEIYLLDLKGTIYKLTRK
jgi:glucose/arabinose dehydrogenase